MGEWTLPKVKARLKGLSDEEARNVVCALVGHSNIQNGCFGYFTCARCGEQVGDSLAGTYQNDNIVIIGHDCDICRANARRLRWQDTFLAPDPFPAK